MKSEDLSYYSKDRLKYFAEGHFTNGVQDGYGRVANRDYDFIYHGFFPLTEDADGIGVEGKTSTGFTSYEGEYAQEANFPGVSGANIDSPQTLKTIRDFDS